MKVSNQSCIEFVNNTAANAGEQFYSGVMSSAPCMFTVVDYSISIKFAGNTAKQSIGHHMYGSCVRQAGCGYLHRASKVGKPYCSFNATSKNFIPINISFLHPNLTETLSPISSAPTRVCLCNSGKPQCMNQMLINVKVYRGERFTLSASVVGYDFGTTIGSIYANFYSLSQLIF